MLTREWNKPVTTLLLALGLWVFCLYVYGSHLTFNFTFDGLAMSGQVEKDNTPLYLFFHPHHLLYTFLGRLFFLWGRAHGATWDGLVALQVLDLLTGTLGVVIAFHLLVRETHDRFFALVSAAGIAFSHSYWYFSTIPGVRIFATVTPLLAWYVLTYLKKNPPWTAWFLGLAHGLAVLGHQTNSLLIPAFLGGIFLIKEKTLWEKLRMSLYYMVSVSVVVLGAYGFIGRYVNYRKTFHDWLWWVFSYFHSPQKWGGYFNETGLAHGQSAMVHAFLTAVAPTKELAENLTYGASETILQYGLLVLLVLFVLRLGHLWKYHRQVLWVSLLWLAAFVPFFVWWEPWNIEFWVSSTIPCWILLGVTASDLVQRWKNPILYLSNRGIVLGLWTGLVTLLCFYNLEGGSVKKMNNHYDFKELLAVVDWKVKTKDLLILDGINNTHYYFDRFQNHPYMSLYGYLRKYKEFGDRESGRKIEVTNDPPPAAKGEAWFDLSESFQEVWKSHRRVWVLTECVDSIGGGRQLLEQTIGVPEGRIREFFKQYELKPVYYRQRAYLYEVVQPKRDDPDDAVKTQDSTPKE